MTIVLRLFLALALALASPAFSAVAQNFGNIPPQTVIVNPSPSATQPARPMPMGSGTGVDIRWFGGKGDNATDNAPALTAALAASHKVTFPSGKFKFNSPVVYTMPVDTMGVNLEGAGSDATELTWPAGGGLKLVYKGQWNTAQVSGLTFSTGVGGAGGNSSGLTLSQSLVSLPTGNTPPSYVNNVVFRGADSYAQNFYWDWGVDIDGVSNVNFLQDQFIGGNFGNPPYHGGGVRFRDGAVTRVLAIYNINQGAFNNLDTGIWHGKYVQGVSIGNTNFTGVNTGYFQPDGTGSSELLVTASQFDCLQFCFNIRNQAGLVITGNQITTERNSSVAIYLGGIGDFNVSNNVFINSQTPGGVQAIEITGYATLAGQKVSGIITGNYVVNYDIFVNYPNGGDYTDYIAHNRLATAMTLPININPGAHVLYSDSPILFGNVTSCSPALEGRTQAFADSNTQVWGVNIAGGGQTPLFTLGVCNTLHWTVIGK